MKLALCESSISTRHAASSSRLPTVPAASVSRTSRLSDGPTRVRGPGAACVAARVTVPARVLIQTR